MYTCPKCKHQFEQPGELSNCPECGEPIALADTVEASGENMDTPPEQELDFELATGMEETFAVTEENEFKDDLLLPRTPIEAEMTTQNVPPVGAGDSDTATVGQEHERELQNEDTEVSSEIFDPDEKQPTIELGEGDRATKTLDYAERMIAGLGERLDGDADYVISMDEEGSELGSGGSGVVYKATQKSLDRTVAIKLLKKQVQAGTQTSRKTTPKQKDVEKFLYESQITAGLDHPNVITVHDLGVTGNDTLFYSMKLFEGGRDWSKEFDRNTLEQNLDIFNDVCDAMRRAHRDRIVHRDLKPQNVLVGDFGEVQVTDWGLAIDLRQQADQPFSGGGTPCYMAPEMAQHYLAQQESIFLKAKLDWAQDHSSEDSVEAEMIQERVRENQYKEQKYRLQISELSDIYVMGAILFQIASGYPPHLFQVSDAQRKQWGGQAGRNKVRRELEMAASRTIAKYMVRGQTNVEAREALRDIALKAMEESPSDRYQNVAELQQAVREFRVFMRCIEDTHRGHREIENSAADSKSYAHLTNAIYAYEGALKNYPDYEPAREGHARARFLFAERALDNQDFELGLSTMTPEAIEDQPDQILATKLRHELVTQRNRRDRRKRLLFVATMASLAAIAMGVISGTFAYFAQQEAVRQNGIAEQKKQEAEIAEERELAAKNELVNSLEDLLKSRDDMIDLKVQSRMLLKENELQQQKTKAAEIETTIANLNSEYEMLQSEDSSKLAEIHEQEAAIDITLANLERINAEIASEKIKESTQFDQYINRLKTIEADIDEDITQSRLNDLFLSEDISLEVKNGWELHHLFKRANPARQPEPHQDLGRINLLEASSDGTVIVAANDRNQLFRGSLNDHRFSLLDSLPQRRGRIVSIDVSANGRWLVVAYDSISEQTSTSTTDSVPVVYDLLRDKVLAFGDSFGESLQFEYVLPESDGKICKEKFFCNVQHVEILDDADNWFRLFMVDQRQSLGLNQFRCSISNVSINNGKLDATVDKIKIAGQLFLKEPGLLTGARCLAAARVESDNTVKVAIINSFPKFSLLTFSFDDALSAYRRSVGKDSSPRDEVRYFESMNRNRINLDRISPGFAPTAIEFVRDNEQRLQLVVGNGKGEVAAVRFNPGSGPGFMLAASATRLLDPFSSLGIDDDSRLLSGETVRVSVEGKRSQRVIDTDPETRQSIQPGRRAIHKSSVRGIESVDNRFVSISESEALIWEFRNDQPVVSKKLFGQSGNVSDFVVNQSDQGMDVYTVSNLAADTSEIRRWTPDTTIHDATIRLTDFRSKSDTRKKIVSGTADQRPDSDAITLGFDDGSVEYFTPETGSITVLQTGADRRGELDELSQDDFRNGRFEYFENRNQLIMYSNSVGMLVWNLNDDQQADPIRVNHSGLFSGEAANSSVFLSSDSQGHNLVSSHPMHRDRILLWQRNDRDEFEVRELGPLTKDGAAATSGLNIFVQPAISPDGRVIAAVLRLRNGYQLQLIGNTPSLDGTLLASFDSPSRTSFRSLQFLGNDQIVLSGDRVQQGVEREIEIVQFNRQPGGWVQQVVELPDSLKDRFRQLSLDQVDVVGDHLTFAGFGIQRSTEDGAAYTSTASPSCVESGNSQELLVWNANGLIARRSIVFSRRISPSLTGNQLAYLVTDGKAGETVLTFESIDNPEFEAEVHQLANDVLDDAADRWQPLDGNRVIYIGKDWFRLATRTNSKLVDQFEFSLANPASRIELSGRTMLIHRLDGTVSLLRLAADDVRQEADVRRLAGFSRYVSLSPDGSRLATISNDGSVALFAVDGLMDGQQQPIAKLQDDAIAVTWMRARALANLGVENVRGDCLVSLTRKGDDLQLQFRANDGQPMDVHDRLARLPLQQPRNESVVSFDFSAVSGNLVAVVWESAAEDRADIFRYSPTEKLDAAAVAEHRWFLVDDACVGQAESVHFSEPIDPAVDGKNFATRIVIGGELKGSKSVKLYALELGFRYRTRPLLELFVSDKLQQVDEIVGARFSGDGKSLLTMTTETAQLRLTDGWSGQKKDVDFANKVRGFQSKLEASNPDSLKDELLELSERRKNFSSNPRLQEINRKKQTSQSELKRLVAENQAKDEELNAEENQLIKQFEDNEKDALTELQSRIDAMKNELK